MSTVDVLSVQSISFSYDESTNAFTTLRDNTLYNGTKTSATGITGQSSVFARTDKENLPAEEIRLFPSLPPLVSGHSDVHLRAGIMNASALANDGVPNAEKAFFVADLSQVYRQHQRWVKCLPDIQPFYGMFFFALRENFHSKYF
jgi:hypothetical protein